MNRGKCVYNLYIYASICIVPMACCVEKGCAYVLPAICAMLPFLFAYVCARSSGSLGCHIFDWITTLMEDEASSSDGDDVNEIHHNQRIDSGVFGQLESVGLTSQGKDFNKRVAHDLEVSECFVGLLDTCRMMKIVQLWLQKGGCRGSRFPFCCLYKGGCREPLQKLRGSFVEKQLEEHGHSLSSPEEMCLHLELDNSTFRT